MTGIKTGLRRWIVVFVALAVMLSASGAALAYVNPPTGVATEFMKRFARGDISGACALIHSPNCLGRSKGHIAAWSGYQPSSAKVEPNFLHAPLPPMLPSDTLVEVRTKAYSSKTKLGPMCFWLRRFGARWQVVNWGPGTPYKPCSNP